MTTVVSHYDNVSHGYKINGQAKLLTCKAVTLATAMLSRATLAGGSDPDQNLKPPGWCSGGCPTHHQRGHLVGNTLGGQGDTYDNLVTLTAGSNHPFMFAIEGKIKRYVCEHSDQSFMYEVQCHYSDYIMVEIAQGFFVPCAATNPFCLFPAPAGLTLRLRPYVLQGPPAWISLGELCSRYEDPDKELGPGASKSTEWLIFNGGYKLNSSDYHQGYCSAKSTLDPANNKNQSDAFVAYATSLGYV